MLVRPDPFVYDPECCGDHWVVQDEKNLAHLVARLVMGHFLHVRSILDGLPSESPSPSPESIGVLVDELTRPEREGTEPWQRDGWLFQMISWIVACQQMPPGSVARAPQIRPSDKGFDGLLVVAKDGDQALVVCEDKATGTPRPTVRDKVWPEIRSIERGDRDNELVSELSAILVQNGDETAIRQSIEQLLYRGRRRYRVSIATDRMPEPSSVFKGYASVVAGPVERRAANALELQDLRSWFRGFTALVAESLRQMGG